MKEIRQITNVVSAENSDENNNDSKKLEIEQFDSEPYFQQVIRPMLVPGHENELIYWLRSFGLIRDIQHCNNTGVDSNCENRIMSWVPARGHDLYQWRCNVCSVKRSIRDDSVFADIKCNMKKAIRILLGWCKGYDMHDMTELIELKKATIGNLYNSCATIAEKYIRSNIADWRVGGPGKIVLIETYPENTNRPTLCILEAQTIPQKCWFESLRGSRSNAEQMQILKSKILSTIREVVLPGSILVLPLNSTYCSYYDVQCLKEIYPCIVSLEGLARHNTEENILHDNLDIIWKAARDLCEESNLYGYQYSQQYLISHMWRNRFRQEAFEMLLYQISLMQ